MNPIDVIGAAVGKRAPAPPPDEKPVVAYINNAGTNTAYAQRALEAECEQVSGAAEGTRNDTLNRAAFSIGQLVAGNALDSKEAWHALTLAARQCGLPDSEIRVTLSSGFKAGAEQPRGVPEQPDPDAWVRQIETAAGQHTITEIDETTGEITERPATPAERAAFLRQQKIAQAVEDLRIKDEAVRLFRAEQAARTFREPPSRLTLTEELLEPDQPVTYAIDELLPTGGNVLLTAGYKTGKTTLVTNLLRAYADHEPFLGRYPVNPGSGRIAIFNYELSPDQYRRWLRDSGIRNTDRVAVLHLRGYRLPLTAPSVEDWIVDWLISRQVSVWIADPFARAATGTDENNNTDVGVWLDTFDVIKQRAGVSEGILPTHTGRAEQEAGQERARGATRLDDWADVRWLLTKDDKDNRFFRATGRDVDVPEELLTYDEDSRQLRIGGGDRRWVARRENEDRVLEFIRENPGCTTREIDNSGGNKGQNQAARGELIRRHEVRIEEVVTGRTKAFRHYANGGGSA